MSIAGRDARIVELLAHFHERPTLDTEEHAAVEHLHLLLAGDADPFARTTLPTHVTSSALVLGGHRDRVLLHLHRRLDRWLQPGGHLEPGERPEEAAIRETIEETGIAVRHPPEGPRIVHLDEHPGPDGHIHLDLRYLLLADDDAPKIGMGETTGVGPGPTLRWVTPAEIADLTDRSLARAVDALMRLHG